MRKKIGIYTIYTTIACIVGYYLIVKYGYNAQDIIAQLWKYNRYILYTAASIIIGASIWDENIVQKRIVIGLLSLVHIISLSKIVIYDQYGTQGYMFLASVLSLCAIYSILWIPKAIIRSILLVPTVCITIISLMIATSPFSQEIKGRGDFYNQQKIVLHIYINEPMLIIQEAQANIIVKNSDTNTIQDNISIEQEIQKQININPNTEIQFGSSIPLINSALFVQTPRGDIYTIQSQSLADISIGTGGLIVQITGVLYTGEVSKTIEQYSDKLYNDYKQKKINYLEQITKNKGRNNIYVQYRGGKIIIYMAKYMESMQVLQQNFEQRQTMRSEVGLVTSRSQNIQESVFSTIIKNIRSNAIDQL